MQAQDTSVYYQQSPLARRLALINICLGIFLTVASLSATLVAVPAISISLNADAVYTSWIPASFLLANLVTLLPAGRMADLYGRKKIYVIGFCLFLLANLFAGLAPSIEILLASRVLQGMGAAMLFSPGVAIVSSVFRDHGRSTAMGWVVGSVYIGLSCGPLLGGWITDVFGWRYIFLFQLPLGLVSILLTRLSLKGEWQGDISEKIDWTGAALFTIAIGLLFVGVTRLPQPMGWLLLIAACALFAVFFRHIGRAPFPLVRLKLMSQNRAFMRSLLASMFLYGGNYSTIFVLSLYLQYNRGLSPTDAGQLIMTQALMVAIVAPLAGRLSQIFAPRAVATLGCLLVALGLGTALSLYQLDSLLGIVTGLIIIGLGFGLFSSPNNDIALGAVPEEKLGIAAAMLSLSRLLGQMFGTAVVTLLMASFIGNAEIGPEHFDALQRVFSWMLAFSIVFATSACFFSSRGLRD